MGYKVTAGAGAGAGGDVVGCGGGRRGGDDGGGGGNGVDSLTYHMHLADDPPFNQRLEEKLHHIGCVQANPENTP